MQWLVCTLAARSGPLQDTTVSTCSVTVNSSNYFTREELPRGDDIVCAGTCLAGFESEDAWAYFAGAMDVTTAVSLLKTEGQYLWRIEPSGLVSHEVDEPVEFILSYAVSNGDDVCHVVFFGAPLSTEGGGGFDYVRFGGGFRDPRLVDRKCELTTCGLMSSLQDIVHVHYADVAFFGVGFANADLSNLMSAQREVSSDDNSESVPRRKTPMPHVATDVRVRRLAHTRSFRPSICRQKAFSRNS